MTQRQRPGDRNYVDNKTFTLALDEYAVACRKANETNQPEPRMSEYIGACILKMSERLSSTPRFRGYTYREEMIGNAIVAAMKYAKNFDGSRFNNGFAYITQILFSHMVMTIKKEKRNYNTNLEMIQQAQLQVFGYDEMSHEIAAHAQMIADQKLQDLESSKTNVVGGFKLRSGYSKEERSKFKGTPMERNTENG
jgi:hypothetical protein